MDNKGFLLATNRLQLQKYQRGWGGPAWLGTPVLASSSRACCVGPCLAFGRRKGPWAKGEYLRRGTLPLPAFPKRGRRPRAGGEPRPEARGLAGGRSRSSTWNQAHEHFPPQPPLQRESGGAGGQGVAIPGAVTQGSLRKRRPERSCVCRRELGEQIPLMKLSHRADPLRAHPVRGAGPCWPPAPVTGPLGICFLH